MRILLDEGVPHPLIRYLDGHDVETVLSRGWTSVRNGKLLKLIADAGFEVLVTGDKNIPAQQTLLGLPFAILILSATNWPVIRPYLPATVEAVDQATPGAISWVECGQFRPRRKPQPYGRQG